VANLRKMNRLKSRTVINF